MATEEMISTATQPRADDGPGPPNHDIDSIIADNILERARALNLDFCVDEVVQKNGDSFSLSILQQLGRRKNLYESLRPAVQALVDNKDTEGFRQMLADYALVDDHGRYSAWPWRSRLNLYEWERRWNEDYLDEATPADDHFIETTARWLGLDIFLTSEDSTGEHPFLFYSRRSSFDPKMHKTDWSTCLFVGREGVNYQNLLPNNFDSILITPQDYPEPEEPKIQKAAVIEMETHCPACGLETDELMRHLRNAECKAKLGEERIQELREKAKKLKHQRYDQSDKRKVAKRRYEESEKGVNNRVGCNFRYLDRLRNEDYAANLEAQRARARKHKGIEDPVPREPMAEELVGKRMRRIYESDPSRMCVVCFRSCSNDDYLKPQPFTNELKKELEKKLKNTTRAGRLELYKSESETMTEKLICGKCFANYSRASKPKGYDYFRWNAPRGDDRFEKTFVPSNNLH